MGDEYEFHEAANIFPLDDENLDALAADIEEHGLQLPIEFCEGKIIDGRRRYLACRLRGMTPDMIDVEPPDPIAYGKSLNLHRRHLTESQRSMVAARAKELYAAKAKERQKATLKRGDKAPDPENVPEREKGDARDQAGAEFGVSGRTVDHASKVLDKGSKPLQDAVDRGEVAVSTAAKLAELPKAEQTRAVKGGKAAIQEATKQSGNGKPDRSYNQFFANLKELSERLDSIVDQFGSLEVMFQQPSWDGFVPGMIDLIHSLSQQMANFDKEAQAYGKKLQQRSGSRSR